MKITSIATYTVPPRWLTWLAPVKRLALVACLVHTARMRSRDDLAEMLCKRVVARE